MFYGFAAALVIIPSTSVLALRERKLSEELDRVRRMVERKWDSALQSPFRR